MSDGARIGGLGELLVEFVRADRDSRNRSVGNYSGPYPSGAPGIFIDQAARVGARALFLGAVGEDAFGDVILERLIADGVDPGLIGRIAGVPTGSAFVSYNGDGSRDFVFNIAHSAASRFAADAPTLAKLRAFRLDAIHVSGSALGDPAMRATALEVCRALRGEGVKVTFDPNVRKELIGDPGYFDAVREIMAMAWIFLPSEEDAEALFPGRGLADFGGALLAGGAEALVLKKGERGCEGLSRAGEHVEFDAHKVRVVDPTGAGDCFCATFVALTLAGGRDFRRVLQLANAAGALAVTKLGPMEGNSSLTELEAFLA